MTKGTLSLMTALSKPLSCAFFCFISRFGLDTYVILCFTSSQWTTMLDRIEEALDAARIRYDRLDGTMKREERSRAMDALKNDPGCEVLLVSLKAGGVGLNLTAAQRVYLMDPYW
jgi:superfamily II DNA/RNA helicase